MPPAPIRVTHETREEANALLETPSSTMYADLKIYGHVSNQSAAELLLSDEPQRGRVAPRDRIKNDRSYPSREIVHANPRTVRPARFADIPQAALTLASRITSELGCGTFEAHEQRAAHYGGPAAEKMCAALDAFSLDSTLYRNALAKIAQAPLSSERSRSVLYLMLFVATGCLGDPVKSVAMVEDFAASKLAAGLYTTEMNVGEGFEPDAPKPKEFTLGLLRVVDGVPKAPIHALSRDPEGTVIGALVSGPNSISDVDGDVSRRHLRVWAEDGRWWAQGLGSTNGSTLISGDTRETRVIEPARVDRERGADYPPVEILNSDTLCLGATTQFLVMQMVIK